MKKRKLNSKNPKWIKDKDEKQYDLKLIKNIKGVKIYAAFEKQ